MQTSRAPHAVPANQIERSYFRIFLQRLDQAFKDVLDLFSAVQPIERFGGHYGRVKRLHDHPAFAFKSEQQPSDAVSIRAALLNACTKPIYELRRQSYSELCS